jgi:hypothetical protein
MTTIIPYKNKDITTEFFDIDNKEMLIVVLLERLCQCQCHDERQMKNFIKRICKYLKKIGIINDIKVYSEDTQRIRKLYSDYIDKILRSNKGTRKMKQKMIQYRETAEPNEIQLHETEQINKLQIISSLYSDNFIELSKIGEGGFGEIYKVYNNLDGQQYAIKKIPFNDLSNTDNMKALNEVKCLAELCHENIVRYHTTWLELSDMKTEFVEESTFQIYPMLYIQMELCECSLRDYLVKRNYSGKDIDMTFERQCITGIINGMKYIHSKNIIHRDINPNNIFLDKYMIPKIGDFGLSTKIGYDNQETIMSSELGVKLYVPPEYINEGIYTKKSDVYSLGIVIFEIMHVFTTDIERIEIIQKLREHKYVNQELMTKYSKYCEYISKMIVNEMDKRISIEEIELN